MEMIQIERETVLAADPQHIFEALTTGINAWWMHMFETPTATIHLEPALGGRFYEEAGQGMEGILYATVTYLEPGKKLSMTGPMGSDGPVLGTVDYELIPEGHGTRLKVSHRMIGAVDENIRASYTEGWHVLLDNRLKQYVEQGQER
jgi:uncharacterized protein YndB with AHSA1/START domain